MVLLRGLRGILGCDYGMVLSVKIVHVTLFLRM